MIAKTEQYDGSSWTEVADLATARDFENAGCGTQTLALAAGGNVPPSTNATEEWTRGQNVKVITD